MRVEGEMVRDTAGFRFDNRRSELKMREDFGIWGDLNDMPGIWKDFNDMPVIWGDLNDMPGIWEDLNDMPGIWEDFNDMRRMTLKKAFCSSYW